MNKPALFFFIILISCFSYRGFCQGVKQPRDITEAIQILNRDCPDSLKTIIKVAKNDTLINFIYPWSRSLHPYRAMVEWIGSNSDNKTKIVKYYAKLGVTYPMHIESIILIAFKNYLNTGSFNHDQIIKPFQKIEEKWNYEDNLRSSIDSLRGVYIPKDLEDCFKQIDRFWSDSTKNQVRKMTEDHFTATAHFGFGTWMRNNWQLWGGSRLTKYFNEKGVYHPESISGIILDTYYRHLKGQAIGLDELIKKDQNYWKVVKAPVKNIYPKGASNLKFNTGFYYDSKTNGQGYIHVGTNDKNDDIWIYDYYFGWAKISNTQMSELEGSKNREEVLSKLFKK